MKKPSVEQFAKVLADTGGNISRTAKAFGVSRSALYKWIESDEDFANATTDARGQLLDECIAVSRIVALGIPEKAPDGRIIGWVKPPDPSMLRYLMSTLGRNEGFGEHIEVKSKTEVKGSIPISDWIKEHLQRPKKQPKEADKEEAKKTYIYD